MDSSAIKTNQIMKLVLGQEIRALPRLPKTMEDLFLAVKKTFAGKIKNSFTLSYKDEEGDRINLDLQEDLDALYELSGSKASYKIEISPVDEEYELIKKDEEPVMKEAPNLSEVRVIEKKEELKDEVKLFSFSLEKPIKILPEKITASSGEFIYAPVTIKNSGMLDFPFNLKFSISSENIKGEPIALPGLKVGEQTVVSLIMENPKMPGEYYAFWELKNEDLTVGSLIINFEVAQFSAANEKKSFYGVKKSQTNQTHYRKDVVDNAKQVQKIFGGDLEKYKELIQSRNFTHLDAIIDEILEHNKALELFQKK